MIRSLDLPYQAAKNMRFGGQINAIARPN